MTPTNTGPGRALVVIYGVLALAACAQAAVAWLVEQAARPEE